MICPYIVHRTVVRQLTSEYDEAGNEVSWQQIEKNTAEPITCLGQACGAWKDGRCAYRGE
jgi:hypothetical protein